MDPSDDDLDALLGEQVAYYRARAPEYDATAEPLTGGREAGEWLAAVSVVRKLGPFGHVLELAAGTGLWTKHLVETATTVTVVDSSPETIELSRRRLVDVPVEYIVGDLFDWEPERQYDTVVFAFWLTHVPPERLTAFWELVEASTRPGGRLIAVDEFTPGLIDAPHVGSESYIESRRTREDREFRIVKVLRHPDRIAASLLHRGWRPTVRYQGDKFFVLEAINGSAG
jgi:ubiquinone/menaquinone biosynthesis C-methylase UbiE